MSLCDNAPGTTAAFGGPDEGGPPPIVTEWHRLLQDDQDLIFVWAGCWNQRGARPGWVWLWSHIGGENDHGGHPHPVTATPAASVERMLSPLAHEARIRIMQALYVGPKSSSELSEATALKGGNLYYHLKELAHAAYLTEKDGAYELTQLGCQMLITVATIADKVVADRGEQGLLVTSASWE